MIMKKLVEMVNEMNNLGFYHCDLKQENVIFKKEEFMLKIIDFGMCI